MKNLCFFAALAAILAFGTGCQSSKPESAVAPQEKGKKSAKLAIVEPGASDFWTIVEAGAKKAAGELGVEVEVIAPSKGDAAEQKLRIEDLLSRGVDGIAFAPIDPKNQLELINTAAAQTNLITTDSDAADSKRLCYVGTDNYAAGKLAGEELKKVLPNGGKVWACVGTMDAQNAHDRYQGIVDALKGSKVEMEGTLTDNTEKAKARSNVEDKLVREPDVAAFVGLWSYNGPAILDAVKQAGKVGKVKIVCFDEDQATLQGVEEGAIFSTVVQNPFEFGYKSVKVLAALARKEDAGIPTNKVIDTGAKVVTKDNVAAFRDEFKKLTGK